MKSQAVRKAVFPIAGLGTRFLPATKAQPKEMLPIVDKPLIQYAVEEAYAAGIRHMIFVTGRSKRAIEDHFDRNFELESRLKEKGKKDEVALLEKQLALVQKVNIPRPISVDDAKALERQVDVATQTQRLTLDIVGLVAFSHDFKPCLTASFWFLNA